MTQIATLPPSQFSFMDESFGNSGNTYAYSITCWNDRGGESDPSEKVEVTPSTIPNMLAAPVEVTHDTSSVTLQWAAPAYDGSTPVTHYVLYWRLEYAAVYTEVYRGTALSYKVANLPTGFYHQFKVLCANKIGTSPLSAASASILTALVPQTAPSGLKLVARSKTDLTFEWEAPSDKGGKELTAYNIYMAKADSLFEILLSAPAALNPSITVHTETQLEQAQLYRFKISAVNFEGEGPVSEEISVISADMP